MGEWTGLCSLGWTMSGWLRGEALTKLNRALRLGAVSAVVCAIALALYWSPAAAHTRCCPHTRPHTRFYARSHTRTDTALAPYARARGRRSDRYR